MLEMREEQIARTIVAGHSCLGYWGQNIDFGSEFCCEYEPDFGCDDCVFVKGYQENDYRKGKRPWRKE
jgi:hypothetical protein